MEGKSSGNSKRHDGERVVAEDLKGEPTIGDVIWVKLSGGFWWPAVIVESNISGSDKHRDRLTKDVCVRLYGSYEYMHVDPIKWCCKFQTTLEENNGSYHDIFRKALERDLSRSKSGRVKGKLSKSKGKPDERVSQERTAPNNVGSSSKKQVNSLKRKLKLDSLNAEDNSKIKSSKKDGTPKKHNLQTSSSDGELSGRSPELCARRIKVMQTLGLAAPSGSPFNKIDAFI